MDVLGALWVAYWTVMVNNVLPYTALVVVLYLLPRLVIDVLGRDDKATDYLKTVEHSFLLQGDDDGQA